MSFLGTWAIDEALYFYANTTRFDTGAATDADAEPTYRVYENETGTALLNGTLSLLDSANTAGFYSETITLSAANGFEAGKQYAIYIAATVNSVAGASHHTFQVRALPLSPTVAGRTLDVSAGGEAGVDWANVGSPTTAVNLSSTNIDVDQVVASVSGAVGSVTGAVGSVTGAVGSVTGAVGSVAGNVDGNVTGTVAGVTPATAAQVAAVLTTQITEAYRANGAAPTLAQFMSEVLAHLGEVAISGTTKTILGLDHVTAKATFTLDDATTPAAITRAT